MSVKQYTTRNLFLSSWLNNNQHNIQAFPKLFQLKKSNLLDPLRKWLDGIKVSDRALAHRLCKFIPTQCPFERQIKLFGYTIVSIPPLCKLNPLYDEVVALRFRAICYLADECGEDVSSYC